MLMPPLEPTGVLESLGEDSVQVSISSNVPCLSFREGFLTAVDCHRAHGLVLMRSAGLNEVEDGTLVDQWHI